MIQNSFSFLQGIGEKTEQKLWARGIVSWDDFLATSSPADMGREKKRFYGETLLCAREHLEKKDARFFAKLLRPREHWKLYPDFREYAVALDIETNGYPASGGGYVTMVGLYDGFDYTALVRGVNLTAENLARELSRYKFLITFFGTVFDVPFLQEAFSASFPALHFDLCFGGKKAGLRGGLKKVEAQLGIIREEAVRGMDGFDAVRLWSEAQRGNAEALELLMSYNRCDTANLFEIADMLYYMLRAQTGINAYCRAS